MNANNANERKYLGLCACGALHPKTLLTLFAFICVHLRFLLLLLFKHLHPKHKYHQDYGGSLCNPYQNQIRIYRLLQDQ